MTGVASGCMTRKISLLVVFLTAFLTTVNLITSIFYSAQSYHVDETNVAFHSLMENDLINAEKTTVSTKVNESKNLMVEAVNVGSKDSYFVAVSGSGTAEIERESSKTEKKDAEFDSLTYGNQITREESRTVEGEPTNSIVQKANVAIHSLVENNNISRTDNQSTKDIKPTPLRMPSIQKEANRSFFDPESVVEFERQEGVVIATKLHGIHQLFILEQSLCLLHYAYNKRVNYDIIAFSTDPIDEKLLEPIRQLVAPAKFSLVVDNRGLQEEIKSASPIRREKLLQRCGVESAENITWWSNCPGRLAYNWQAEFRAWHIWRYPALAPYRYMLWMDADGFPTKIWERDPVAFMIKNQLVILFDNFPQGRTTGREVQNRVVKSFNKTLCRVSLSKDGVLKSSIGANCQSAVVPMIHGFFHITDLDFYRSDEVINFEKKWIGDCFLCREFDDQAGVTIPAAMLAPNRSWSMREHNLTMNVFHNHVIDGKEQAKPAGFLGYWEKHVKYWLPEASGICPVKAGG